MCGKTLVSRGKGLLPAVTASMTRYPLEFENEKEQKLWENYKRKFPRDVTVDVPLKEFIKAIADDNVTVDVKVVQLPENVDSVNESDYNYKLNPDQYFQ